MTSTRYMTVVSTEDGPSLVGEPAEHEWFHHELLESADGRYLVVDGEHITLHLVNARVVYKRIRSFDRPGGDYAACELVSWVDRCDTSAPGGPPTYVDGLVRYPVPLFQRRKI